MKGNIVFEQEMDNGTLKYWVAAVINTLLDDNEDDDRLDIGDVGNFPI